VAAIVEAYQGLLAGKKQPDEVFRSLRTEGGYGVVRGSLRLPLVPGSNQPSHASHAPGPRT
jgi:hypothetical protein